jgi:hypothetical protein
MIVVAHKTKKTMFRLKDHCSSLHHCFLSEISISVPYYIFFRIAVTKGSTLKNELGIKNGIHRQKISVQAMDLVLFGPPKGTLYTTCCIYIILTVHISTDKSLRNLLTVVQLFRILTGYCLAYDWTGKGNERLSDHKSPNRMVLYQQNKT